MATEAQDVDRRVRRRRRLLLLAVLGGLLVIALAVGAGLYLDQPGAGTAAAFLPVYLLSLVMLAASASNRRALARPVLGRVAVGASLVVSLACLAVVFLSLAAPPPWTSPRWPGVREAAHVPEACAVVPEATLARLVPGERTPSSGITTDLGDPEHRTECVWETDAGNPGAQGRLSLIVSRSERDRRDGATRLAEDQVASWRSGIEEREGSPEPVPEGGIGDAAWVYAQADPGASPGLAEATVIARRANVAVWVEYEYRPSRGEAPDAGLARAGAVEVTRAAVESITLP